MFAAWNEGDDLNTYDVESEDDDDDDDEAGVASKSAAVPTTTRRGNMLRRLDNMLVVPPVRPLAATDQLPDTADHVGAGASAAASAAFASSSSAPASCPSCSILRSCSSCVIDRPECAFSGAQLKRKGKRVCKVCVARREGSAMPVLHSGVPEPLADAPTAPNSNQQPSFDSLEAALRTPSAFVASSSTAAPASSSSRSAALFQSIMLTAQENLKQLENAE
jgi:hypothetical protein